MYTGRVNSIMDLLKTLFKKMDTHVLAVKWVGLI